MPRATKASFKLGHGYISKRTGNLLTYLGADAGMHWFVRPFSGEVTRLTPAEATRCFGAKLESVGYQTSAMQEWSDIEKRMEV